jgi:hypothetical protein
MEMFLVVGYMKILAWLALAIALIAFVVETGFFALASAERVMAAGLPFKGYRRLVVKFWLLVGVPADALYNLTVGTIVFRELPREWLYSSRVARLARAGNPKAIAERDFLNAAAPGHIQP